MINDFDFVKFREILKKVCPKNDNLCYDEDIERVIVKYCIGDNWYEFIKILIDIGLIKQITKPNGKLAWEIIF
jgi:hypothetical protein